MTAERDVIIPGLDHSLCKAGGLLLWCKTPGSQPTQERKNGVRRKAKAAARRDAGQDTGQETLWEDLA